MKQANTYRKTGAFDAATSDLTHLSLALMHQALGKEALMLFHEIVLLLYQKAIYSNFTKHLLAAENWIQLPNV